jgi:transcriptional regulator GlxA family with amidase domain
MFGFLMFPGFEELDLVGPWEMATMWHAYAGGPACVTVAKTAGPVRAAKGLQTVADVGFADCPSLDYLLVPGGFAVFDVMRDDATLAFLRERAAL